MKILIDYDFQSTHLTISAADPNPKYSISCLTSNPTTWQDKTSAI